MTTLPIDDTSDDLFGSHVLSPTPSFVSAFANDPEFSSIISDAIEVIEQPCCSKLRARNEYLTTRRDPLSNKGIHSDLPGPVIQIPSEYISPDKQYYIGVSLATIIYEKNNIRFKHPYILESIDNREQNDTNSRIVWYPITHRDQHGIKSFPDLRIVKITEEELETNGQLCPFNGYNISPNDLPKLTSGRQIVQEYSLKRMVLAFSVGEKLSLTDTFPTILNYPATIFSDEVLMMEGGTKASNEADSTESAAKPYLPPPPCKQRKYAPRNGDTDGNQEMLVFCTRKIDEKKYGPLQVTFECDEHNIGWSVPIFASDLEVKDQMVSFKTPKFPSAIDTIVRVKIVLRQNNQTLDTFSYFYIPKHQCSTCLQNTTTYSNFIVPGSSNKRARFAANMFGDFETDAVVPRCEDTPVFRQSKSEPESQTSFNSSDCASSSETNRTDAGQQLADQVQRVVTSLFVDDDYKPLLRICRSFIRRQPELLHSAIINNHSDLLTEFILTAEINLLRHTNQLGDTLLLHAVRLNRLNVVRAVLQSKDIDQLLIDRNDRNENIFHILASNSDSKETLDVLMEYLHRKSIDIGQKFDDVDDDSHTPLQVAIMNNNLVATRHLFAHSKTDVYETDNHIGDNLIHLAVRYADLAMLKYLLDEEQLIELGNLSNKVMTPSELARSMNRNDMVEYLNEMYPQPTSDTDENTESD